MAGNAVTLTFAGDSAAAERAAARVGQATTDMASTVGAASTSVGRALGSIEQAFDSAGRSANALGEKLDMMSGGFSQLSGGIGDIGGAMTAFVDMQDAAAAKADTLAQAQINVEKAQKELDEAVKTYGKDSIEAREAQLALNQAQRDAEPPGKLEEWGSKLEMISPIIMGVVGATDLLMLGNTLLSASWVKTAATTVGSSIATAASATATGIATAAQWAWNAALSANPIGLVVLAIAALVAVVVVIATKTTWFQTIWRVAWGGIKAAAVNVWEWLSGLPDKLGSTFSRVSGAISSPFKSAFNAVSRAWNNTVGRLSWTVPGWVPGVGGSSISAPRLPEFHTGGTVPGVPGQEVLAVLQAGETVIPAGGNVGATIIIRGDGSRVGDLLVAILREAIEIRGGNVQAVVGSTV